jgi:hypothetical protein
MTATATAAPGDAFAIGVTPADTAANLRTKLEERLAVLAETKLAAASATQASREFFDLDASRVPQRVAGYTTVGEPARTTTLATATGVVDAQTTDTVFWYRGDLDTTTARDSAMARIDQSITISYGAQANEESIRNVLASIGAFAAVEFDPADPRARDRHAALADRAASGLVSSPGRPRVDAMIVELTTAQVSMKAAKDRHTMARGSMLTMLDEIKGVDTQEVAATILSLQTRLQASYQTTAILSRLSLVQYL